MTLAPAAAVAVTFVWLGMVLAISFLETPLKFRAPGVTLPIGLGIGRLVFRALNAAEAVLALALLVTVIAGKAGDSGTVPTGALITAAVTAVLLLAQITAVRPRLSRRSDRILAGHDAPRSHAHYAYVGVEVLKVAGLIITGVFLLTV